MAVLRAGNASVELDQMFDDGVMKTKTRDQEQGILGDMEADAADTVDSSGVPLLQDD